MLLPKNTAAKKQWEAIGLRHHHGIALPLFSLWTEKSSGIGEYLDLIPVIDWCQDVGFDVIQLLPINDTHGEISPYSALSAFALNPLHLSLNSLPGFKEALPSPLKKSRSLDYEAVSRFKEEFLRKLFEREGRAYLESREFIAFAEEEPWVENYSVYKAIRARGDEALSQNKVDVDDALLDDAEYHAFLQFLSFRQMRQVKEYAEKKKVLIKGDIPILVSPRSADVVLNEDLFRLDLNAGAPPDAYCKEGQNWGFPLYDWERSEEKILAWWKERLSVAGRLYHLYRLDHVVGLFRMWGIPPGKKPTEGFFVPQEVDRWIPHGKKLIEAFLNDSPMLPIAEDLGTVPKSVRSCLESLGVPGTKVLRWEVLEGNPLNYLSVSSYPAFSMTTVSTHDTETMKSWWETSKPSAKAFALANSLTYRESYDDDVRESVLRLSHTSSSLFHINLLQEYFPESSSLSFDSEEAARVNDPADDRRALNWKVRYKEPFEKIVDDKPFNDLIRRVLKAAP